MDFSDSLTIYLKKEGLEIAAKADSRLFYACPKKSVPALVFSAIVPRNVIECV